MAATLDDNQDGATATSHQCQIEMKIRRDHHLRPEASVRRKVGQISPVVVRRADARLAHQSATKLSWVWWGDQVK